MTQLNPPVFENWHNTYRRPLDGSGPPHLLIVYIEDPLDPDNRGYGLEHPDGQCPKRTITYEAPGKEPITWVEWECGAQHEADNAGMDCFFEELKLPEGEFEIEHWSERHPGGPWGGEEWEGGLRFTEAGEAAMKAAKEKHESD